MFCDGDLNPDTKQAVYRNGGINPYSITNYELVITNYDEWERIADDNLFIVDVGISCVGTKSLFPDYPKQNSNESDDNFARRVNNWINKRNITYQQWDDIKSEREDEFTEFIEEYQGEILRGLYY
jgi:hypothetical protein